MENSFEINNSDSSKNVFYKKKKIKLNKKKNYNQNIFSEESNSNHINNFVKKIILLNKIAHLRFREIVVLFGRFKSFLFFIPQILHLVIFY